MIDWEKTGDRWIGDDMHVRRYDYKCWRILIYDFKEGSRSSHSKKSISCTYCSERKNDFLFGFPFSMNLVDLTVERGYPRDEVGISYSMVSMRRFLSLESPNSFSYLREFAEDAEYLRNELVENFYEI